MALNRRHLSQAVRDYYSQLAARGACFNLQSGTLVEVTRYYGEVRRRSNGAIPRAIWRSGISLQGGYLGIGGPLFQLRRPIGLRQPADLHLRTGIGSFEFSDGPVRPPIDRQSTRARCPSRLATWAVLPAEGLRNKPGISSSRLGSMPWAA
jgi:hypothetical protein